MWDMRRDSRSTSENSKTLKMIAMKYAHGKVQLIDTIAVIRTAISTPFSLAPLLAAFDKTNAISLKLGY